MIDTSAADHDAVSCAATKALTTAKPTTPKIEAITPAIMAFTPTLGIDVALSLRTSCCLVRFLGVLRPYLRTAERPPKAAKKAISAIPIGTAVTTMDCSAADHVEVSCAPTNALTTANPTTPKIEAITPAMIALMPTLGILRQPFTRYAKSAHLVSEHDDFAVGINYTKKRKSQHLTLCLAPYDPFHFLQK